MSYRIAVILGASGTWFPESTYYGTLDDAIAGLVDAQARGRNAQIIYGDPDRDYRTVDTPSEQECMAIAWGALTLSKYLPLKIHRNEDGTEQVLMKSGKTILHRHAVPGQPVKYWTSKRDMDKRYPNDREF